MPAALRPPTPSCVKAVLREDRTALKPLEQHSPSSASSGAATGEEVNDEEQANGKHDTGRRGIWQRIHGAGLIVGARKGANLDMFLMGHRA